MAERNRTLIAYINPFGDKDDHRNYPTALVAAVTEEGGQCSLVYPGGDEQPLQGDAATLARTYSNEPSVRFLLPEAQIPFRMNEFLYGVAPGHVVFGTEDMVLTNLRLHITHLDPKSVQAQAIQNFIMACSKKPER